jgi:cyanophycin synthetase
MGLKKVKATNLSTYLSQIKSLALDFEVLTPNLAEIKSGKKSCFFYLARTPINSFVSANLSVNKFLTSLLLKKKGLPILKTYTVKNKTEVLIKAEKIGYPLVLKPLTGKQGKKVFLNIESKQELTCLLKNLEKDLLNQQFVLEKYVQGQEYRLLILNDKVIGAVKKSPAFVIGNGKNNIKNLIKKLNSKRRQKNKKLALNTFSLINIDSGLKNILKKQKFSLNSIPEKSKKVYLSFVSNRSKGGFTTTLKTGFFHPSVLRVCKKALKVLDLKFAAVDFILKDPKKPFTLKNGVILELNASPGINLHHYPDFGKRQNVAKIVLEFLFKKG